MKIFLKVLPGLLILSIAIVALIVVQRVSVTPRALPYDKQPLARYNDCLASAGSSGTLDPKRVTACGAELAGMPVADDFMKARMDELRWMLTIIGSLAAFFAIAQGAAAYFSAQNYTKSADEAIARIDKQEASVRARYPLFEAVEKARDDAYTQLRLDLKTISKVEDPAADPLEALALIDRFYGGLPVERRQTLLSVESFASADLGGNRTSDEEYASDLVRLAIFYQSKFFYEDGHKRSNKSELEKARMYLKGAFEESQARGNKFDLKKAEAYLKLAFEDKIKRGNIADLERAQTYLKLAGSKAPLDFTILNELGVLYINFHRALHPDEKTSAYLDEAEGAFERSMAMEKSQQRAYYNMGTVHGRYRKDYPTGIRWLNKAKQFDKWQRLPVAYSSSFIYYNHGCYEAKQLEGAQTIITASHASDCLAALAKAAEYRCIPAEYIREDFEQHTGDLFNIYARADVTLKKKLDEMKAELLKPGPPKPVPRPGIRAAVMAFWHTLHPPPAA